MSEKKVRWRIFYNLQGLGRNLQTWSYVVADSKKRNSLENMKNNTEILDEFFNLLNEKHSHSVEKINKALYDDICKTAEIIDKTESEAEKKALKESLRERVKNIDLNQVTDLFIHNQMFFTSNEDPLPTASLLCITIGKLFTEQNLRYIASKVYSDDPLEGGCALSFLVYLTLLENEGMYMHRDYILSFIKENFEGFSQDNKTKCVFQLDNYLPDDKVAQQIIHDSGITAYVLTLSTGEDSISRPITFKFDNDAIAKSSKRVETIATKSPKETIEPKVKTEKLALKTPWWQFWK